MSTLHFAQFINWKDLRQNCARPGCPITALRHSWIGRGVGVRIGNDWFCCPDCLREGVQIRIRDLRQSKVSLSKQHPARIPLGLLLMSRGYISHGQLQTAIARQQARGGSIGHTLCELQFVTERQVAEAAATQWGCPFFSVKSQGSEIPARIPVTLMRLVKMAPVHFAQAQNRLLVGFVHNVEHQLLRTIEAMAGCIAEPCFITATECSECILAQAVQHVEVSFGPTASTAEIANIVQSYASQLGADEVRLACCHDHLWIRLNRRGYPTDLVFALNETPAKSAHFDDYCSLN